MSAHTPTRSFRPAIYFAVLMAFQSVGWLLAWEGMQREAKIKARQALHHGQDLQERTFHKTQLRQIVLGKKELYLEGQLFDYRILSEQGDSIRLSLYRDQKEEALFEVLHALYDGDKDADASGMPLAFWLAKWLGMDFILPKKPVLCPFFVLMRLKQHLLPPDVKPQSRPEILAPPPKAPLNAARFDLCSAA